MSVTKPFGLRLKPDLKDQAKEAAKTKRWSLNTFVAYAVEEQLKREEESKAA